ncbi:rhomboid family intramembrane serine protease [Myroides sp. LJL119]
MGDISFLVLLIMGLTALVTYKGLNDTRFFNKYCFDLQAVRKGQYYRILTSGFLHVDWMHFIFNMLTFYFFAEVVLYQVGNLYFVLIYLASIILGNLITYQIYYNKSSYYAVGASGGVMGVLYSSIIMFPDMTLGLFFIIPIPSYLFAILYMGYSVYGMKSNRDLIGHSAHIGGALAGLILTLVHFPFLFGNRVWLIALLVLPILVLVYFYKKGKI